MNIWEKEPIPLFWHQEQPINIYILKNKVLHCFNSYGGYGEFNPIVSFNLLLQLFKHPMTREQLPKELQPVFEEMEPYPVIDDMYHHFAGVNDPHGYTSYLNFKMKIRERKAKPIIFHNISFREKLLKETLELSVQDAFYLIANSCASTRITRIQEVLRNSFEPCFHQMPKEKVTECVEQTMYQRHKKDKLLISPEYRAQLIGGVNQHEKFQTETIYKFIIEYLAHLNQLLQKKELNPFNLLRLSGTRPLAFLLSDEQSYSDFIQEFFEQLTKVSELTSIQKLVYFTFLEVAKYDVKRDEACTKMEPLFTKLYKEHFEARKQLHTHMEGYLPESWKRFRDRYS